MDLRRVAAGRLPTRRLDRRTCRVAGRLSADGVGSGEPAGEDLQLVERARRGTW
ncbi:hypothetical protein [Streptomyces sp. NPDC048057]|uniref:hypothetical protein n=1 Tax=Streptomyces sp. NPDC048057 TaxID=3155628 RepID=UPI00340FEE32